MTHETTFEALIEEIESDPAEREREEEWRPSRETAHLLMRLRVQQGLSQRQLASVAGVSPAYISQLESGTANPSVRRLNAVFRAAGARLELRAVTEEAAPAKRKRRAS